MEIKEALNELAPFFYDIPIGTKFRIPYAGNISSFSLTKTGLQSARFSVNGDEIHEYGYPECYLRVLSEEKLALLSKREIVQLSTIITGLNEKARIELREERIPAPRPASRWDFV